MESKLIAGALLLILIVAGAISFAVYQAHETQRQMVKAGYVQCVVKFLYSTRVFWTSEEGCRELQR